MGVASSTAVTAVPPGTVGSGGATGSPKKLPPSDGGFTDLREKKQPATADTPQPADERDVESGADNAAADPAAAAADAAAAAAAEAAEEKEKEERLKARSPNEMLRYACTIGDSSAIRTAIRAGADPNLNDLDLHARAEQESKDRTTVSLQIEVLQQSAPEPATPGFVSPAQTPLALSPPDRARHLSASHPTVTPNGVHAIQIDSTHTPNKRSDHDRHDKPATSGEVSGERSPALTPAGGGGGGGGGGAAGGKRVREKAAVRVDGKDPQPHTVVTIKNSHSPQSAAKPKSDKDEHKKGGGDGDKDKDKEKSDKSDSIYSKVVMTGDYPLHLAVENGHAECARLLIRHYGAKLENKNRLGSTALHRAVSMNRPELVTLLLGCGASYTAPNAIGNRPLHIAAYGGFVECTQILLVAGANVDAHMKNAVGMTPLMYVKKQSLQHLISTYKTGQTFDSSPLPDGTDSPESTSHSRHISVSGNAHSANAATAAGSSGGSAGAGDTKSDAGAHSTPTRQTRSALALRAGAAGVPSMVGGGFGLGLGVIAERESIAVGSNAIPLSESTAQSPAASSPPESVIAAPLTMFGVPSGGGNIPNNSTTTTTATTSTEPDSTSAAASTPLVPTASSSEPAASTSAASSAPSATATEQPATAEPPAAAAAITAASTPAAAAPVATDTTDVAKANGGASAPVVPAIAIHAAATASAAQPTHQPKLDSVSLASGGLISLPASGERMSTNSSSIATPNSARLNPAAAGAAAAGTRGSGNGLLSVTAVGGGSESSTDTSSQSVTPQQTASPNLVPISNGSGPNGAGNHASPNLSARQLPLTPTNGELPPAVAAAPVSAPANPTNATTPTPLPASTATVSPALAPVKSTFTPPLLPSVPLPPNGVSPNSIVSPTNAASVTTGSTPSRGGIKLAGLGHLGKQGSALLLQSALADGGLLSGTTGVLGLNKPIINSSPLPPPLTTPIVTPAAPTAISPVAPPAIAATTSNGPSAVLNASAAADRARKLSTGADASDDDEEDDTPARVPAAAVAARTTATVTTSNRTAGKATRGGTVKRGAVTRNGVGAGQRR